MEEFGLEDKKRQETRFNFTNHKLAPPNMISISSPLEIGEWIWMVPWNEGDVMITCEKQ